MRVSEVLRKAKALVERGWCQAADALNRAGDNCECSAEDAVPWCAYGAIRRVHENTGEADRSVLALVAAIPGVGEDFPLERVTSLTRWNDTPGRTKGEVLALFTQTIRRAEVAEQEEAGQQPLNSVLDGQNSTKPVA
jgi:hypothetical protein